MANLAGFVIGNAIGGTRAGLVASLMPSPLVGAIVAQAFVDREDDGGEVERLQLRAEREQESVAEAKEQFEASKSRLYKTKKRLEEAEAKQGADQQPDAE